VQFEDQGVTHSGASPQQTVATAHTGDADHHLAQQPDAGHSAPLGRHRGSVASVLPYAIILHGVRRGRLSDKNLSLRQERIRFGAVAITSVLIVMALLAAFDAPAELVALLASIAVGVACG